jgi:hypothetical protein
MWHISFIEIDFTGRTDFVVVRYWVTKNDVLSDSRFRFQDDVVNVNLKEKYMFNVFVSISYFIPGSNTLI